MQHRCVSWWTCVFAIAALPAVAYGQSATYHLHKEASKTAGLLQLKTAAPDAAAAAMATDLKKQPVNEYLIKAFDTPAGVPNAGGIVPAGSVVSFSLWMRKTSTAGVMYPRARLKLNSATGSAVCTATGDTALTTRVASYTLTCTTTANIAMSASDRFYLWAGVNLTAAPGNSSLKAELNIEGTLNGNYDSQVTAPLPVAPPAIATLSPPSGVPGTSISISGSNFGSSQGASTVTFNGLAAASTVWSTSSIATVVPAGAITGAVVVTVRGLASNGVPFTVLVPPSIAGVVSRATGGSPIANATVAALLSGAVVGAATTGADGSYALANLDSGSYGLRVAASGYSDEVRAGVLVAVSATTTVNVAMSLPGAVSGRVTESDGTTPIGGAAVTVFAGGSRIGITNTDASGNYLVALLHPGTYTVQAASVGHRTKEQVVVVAENAATVVMFALDSEPTGPIAYAYDALGRLIQVTDPSGDFAVYRYDAVGNILAIDRPAGGMSISGFSPNIGPIGAGVAIFGGGFSTDPSQSLVTFNGVPATVEAASPTQLVTTVPAGATTGPIGVVTPHGSATSSTPFMVSANSGSPTVTGFTPSIGVAGTPVTVTGTNFDSAPVNDRAELNGRLAAVTSANSSTLATTVPSFAMGGHIAVSTPFGRAVSDSDFFVVPSPYGPPDVGATDRLTIGASRAVTIGTSGTIGLVLFDGADGQQVSFIVTNSTIPAGAITIYRPDGQVITSFSPATNTFVDSLTLYVSGTYTMLIDPASTSTGSLTLNSYTFADVTGPVMTDGTGVPVSITAPGQKALLTFTGTAGQLVSATATSSTWTNCQFGGQYDLALLNPDGSLLGSVTNACGSTTVLEHQRLPVSGTFTLRINPYGTNTGSATLAVYAFNDVTGPIPTDGTPVPVAITAPGQIALVTFSGTAGQLVSTTSTSGTWTSCQFGGQYALSILQPDGSTLASGSNACGTTTMLEHYTLPVSGTYSVKLDPYGANTGSATLKAWTFADVTASIAADGTNVSVSITVPGQNARLAFTGTAGQAVSVLVPTATIPGTCLDYAYWLSILKPDGSTLGEAASCSGTAFLDQRTLPVSGTYTLVLNPLGVHTGDATLRLFTVVDVTGPIAPDGTSTPVSIATPGQNARLTFTGAAGQIVSATATNNTLPGNCLSYPYYLTILKPDGSTLATSPSCGGNLSLSQKTLPVNGTYTLLLDPTGANTGSIVLTLTSP